MAARRRSTYGLRLIAALPAVSIIVWLSAFSTKGQPPQVLAQSLFSALTSLAFIYSLLIGPFLTADTISAEKREGTLGLLFLTDLNSLNVVLGKWAASSLTGLYGLLAVLPSLGIPLLLGGITPGEYARTALAIVNAILFALAAGLLVSAVSRDQSKAVLGSLILVLTLSGLLPGVMALFGNGFWGRGLWGYPPLALASPIFAGQFALDTAFKANPKLFWYALGVIHSMTWLLMIATVFVVARIWRKESAEPMVRSHRWIRLGRTTGWQRRLKRRLERNPVYSVASRHRWPHWLFWILVGIVTINIYWLTRGVRNNAGAYQFHEQFSNAMYFINRIWLATMACRFFVEARRTGALELLLTTPLPDRVIRKGRRMALIRLFFWPVLAIACLHGWYLWESTRPYAQQPIGAPVFRQFSLITAGSLAGFVTDVLALSAVGAWFSLASRNVRMVVLKTFAWVILLPWALLRLTGFYHQLSTLLPGFYLYLVPTITVGKNLAFLAWATHRTKKHFRAAASQTYRLRRFLRPSNENRGEPTEAPAI